MIKWKSGLEDPRKQGLYIIRNMHNPEWTKQSFEVAWFDGYTWKSVVNGAYLPTPFFWCKNKYWNEVMGTYYEE